MMKLWKIEKKHSDFIFAYASKKFRVSVRCALLAIMLAFVSSISFAVDYDIGSDWDAAQGIADDEFGRNGHPELEAEYTNPDLNNAMKLKRMEDGNGSRDNVTNNIGDVLDKYSTPHNCSFTSYKEQYMSDESKSYCWYCNIVSTMTNAYLTAVADVMNILVTLGKLILRYGFLIWLAYYILQQVSSLAPVKPSKMLQDILIMGFKVAVAVIAVTQGIGILTHYFLDPVMLLGIDFGESMLDGVLEMNIKGGAS